MTTCPRPSGEHGFALVLVLWLLVPLALVFLLLVNAARSDARLASNLRAAAETRAAADGAINQAIFGLLQPLPSSPFPGSAHGAVRVGNCAVQVDIVGQSGLVNPNLASAELMRALLLRLGLGFSEATQLADAIVEWRTPGQRPGVAPPAARYRAAGLPYAPTGAPFESLAELGDVLGMTPGILAALLPYLTIYSDRDPVPALAAPVVRSALRDAGISGGAAPPGDEVVRIDAVAQQPGGARAARQAIVRIGRTANHRDWRVLMWRGRDGE